MIGAAAFVLLAAVLLGIFVLRGDASASVGAEMKAAGCTLKTAKAAKENLHLATLEQRLPKPWNTFPPTSGYHAQRPAIWDFYEEPVNPKQVVHNQEHGGVAIWWGPGVPASTVEQLRAFYQESPNAMLGTPHPRLGNKIALTAWTGGDENDRKDTGLGHIATCTAFDADAFRAFRDAYRGRGPEAVPVSVNAPGT